MRGEIGRDQKGDRNIGESMEKRRDRAKKEANSTQGSGETGSRRERKHGEGVCRKDGDEYGHKSGHKPGVTAEAAAAAVGGEKE